MIIIKRKKYFLKIAEVYFSNDDTTEIFDADIIIHLQASKNTGAGRPFYTLHINLNKDEDVLFSEMDKNTRYEIRRANEKDNLSAAIYNFPSGDQIKEFCNYFNKFAITKKLGTCNENKLKVLREIGALSLSFVKDSKGEILCYHAYIVDRNRSRLLYSASHFRLYQDNSRRALYGRANRYLHWADMKYFKKKGLLIYDFGGLSMNKENKALSNIDDFKKSFGGNIVIEYNYYKPKTLLGKIAMLYLSHMIL